MAIQKGDAVAADRALAQLLAWATLFFTALVVWQLTYPFNFQVVPGSIWLAMGRVGRINSAADALMFIPFGFCAAWFGYLATNRWRLAVIPAVVVAGFVLALLGETAQHYLPERDSSVRDLVINVFGAGTGAVAGFVAGPAMFLKQARVWIIKLSSRPRGRLAWLALFLVGVIRTYPFDLSPDISDLGKQWHESMRSGFPFHAVSQWLRHDVDPVIAERAQHQLLAGGANWLLFAICSCLVGRAMRESFERKGDRTSPALFVLVLMSLYVLFTELLQWPLKSRLMDGTDVVAGIAGVAAGVVTEELIYQLHRFRTRAERR